VVHLKRFSSAGYRRDKLDILVDFPVEGLDLTRRVIGKEDGKQDVYDLIAVDDHWGGLGGGHYTAFAKNFIDGQWYEYNGELPHEPLSAGNLSLLTPSHRCPGLEAVRYLASRVIGCVPALLPPPLRGAARRSEICRNS
jgi:ubiquitin C-terminal hydrolase